VFTSYRNGRERLLIAATGTVGTVVGVVSAITAAAVVVAAATAAAALAGYVRRRDVNQLKARA